MRQPRCVLLLLCLACARIMSVRPDEPAAAAPPESAAKKEATEEVAVSSSSAPPKVLAGESKAPSKAEAAPPRSAPAPGSAPGAALPPPHATVAAAAPPAREPPKSAGLQAGSADDNLQYNAFVHFLAEHGRRGLPHHAEERVIVEVRDSEGLPAPDVTVSVLAGGHEIFTRRTFSDGRALLFPGELPDSGKGARVQVGKTDLPLVDPQSGHLRSFRLDTPRKHFDPVPLDVAFVLDSTGSMTDEIARLKQTLDVIHFQLTHLVPAPDVRFGLVEYKDRGDDFVTRAIPFTRDVEAFRASLASVRAYGGGDEPEDVQAGLEKALHGLEWRSEGVKLAFLIGDAAPHLDYGETFTYVSAMHEAAQRGIKITAVGCSGLPIEGEVVWREIAQYTMAPYVFLSRGEKGDSEGSASSVSHHVGSNWVAENLEAIVIRFVKSELANLSTQPVAQQRDYFEARAGGSSDAVLQDLFRQSIKQLVDYSVEKIEDKTPTVLLPLSVKSKRLDAVAPQLESRLQLGLVAGTPFRLVERAAMGDLIRALEAQQGDNFDSRRLVEAGKLVPARLAVMSQLAEDAKGDTELLVKLVRLETGEMLSLSLLKIDPALLR
jgi:hypothetical protein